MARSIQTAAILVEALDREGIPCRPAFGTVIRNAEQAAPILDPLIPGALALIVALLGKPIVRQALLRKYYVANDAPNAQTWLDGDTCCSLGALLHFNPVRLTRAYHWPDPSIAAESMILPSGGLIPTYAATIDRVKMACLVVMKANDCGMLDLSLPSPWTGYLREAEAIHDRLLGPIIAAEEATHAG
jgi:hypothetical protein